MKKRYVVNFRVVNAPDDINEIGIFVRAANRDEAKQEALRQASSKYPSYEIEWVRTKTFRSLLNEALGGEQ